MPLRVLQAQLNSGLRWLRGSCSWTQVGADASQAARLPHAVAHKRAPWMPQDNKHAGRVQFASCRLHKTGPHRSTSHSLKHLGRAHLVDQGAGCHLKAAGTLAFITKQWGQGRAGRHVGSQQVALLQEGLQRGADSCSRMHVQMSWQESAHGL